MLRGMVFVDHMNFDIALQQYYLKLGKQTPKLDYNKFFRELVSLVPNVDFIKAFLFIPKPDDFLMKDSRLCSYYNWAVGLKNAPYIDVLEGSYIARPVLDNVTMNINDKSTFYKVEKGTDINLAVHAVSKAFYNSYDIGFFLSADTDYVTAYNALKTIGKLAIVAVVNGQSVNRLKQHIDNHLVLSDDFFTKCLR